MSTPTTAFASTVAKPSTIRKFSELLLTNRRAMAWGAGVSLLLLVPVLWRLVSFYELIRGSSSKTPASDADNTDPSLLRKHTTFRSFHVPSTGFTYPSIRVVYRGHTQADKLPQTPSALPLLVFVHGLGGSAAQFAPLLNSLINVGPCLAIDLPGCGRSQFSPKDWSAYTQPALAALVAVIAESYRDPNKGQGLIFVAHSMGCSLAARIAGGDAYATIKEHICGLIALCPRASNPSEARVRSLERLAGIPTRIFDLVRAWDRRGGVESASVRRFAGPHAEAQTKKLQYRFNVQSKTDVFRRMMYGALPIGSPLKVGLANTAVWMCIDCPILLIGGAADNLNPASEVHELAELLSREKGVLATTNRPQFGGVVGDGNPEHGVKSVILPAPASHALLFAPAQCRVVSGLVQAFLADHIDKRLSLGWQLQHLSKEGKWDVKNLEKWRKIQPVSDPIGGIFRAMKTMREVDDEHNPTNFARKWKGQVKAVVDISHEAPVYDPRKLEAGGITYEKFPTVSKLPPSAEETAAFNDLVDRLRASSEPSNEVEAPLIAVHCHYGFNRTGYFVICYLVDKLHWELNDAIHEFEKKRPPGVKHQYFIDELYVRYCFGHTHASW